MGFIAVATAWFVIGIAFLYEGGTTDALLSALTGFVCIGIQLFLERER